MTTPGPSPASPLGESRGEGTARCFKAVVLGVSMGGVEALKFLVHSLEKDLPVPILVVQHMNPESMDDLARLLANLSGRRVKEADEGELPEPGTVYLAPANYHLVVEPDGRLGLSTDPLVHFARPSVDVLFETAADAWGAELIGVVLTGAGQDGAEGLKRIRDKGGVTIIQDPEDADMDGMPNSALALHRPDHVTTLAALPSLLARLLGGEDEGEA